MVRTGLYIRTFAKQLKTAPDISSNSGHHFKVRRMLVSEFSLEDNINIMENFSV